MITINAYDNKDEKIVGHVVSMLHFRSGELDLTLPTKILDADIIHTEICWDYETEEELFAVYSIVRTLKNVRRLYMPYLPNARMDRVGKESHNVFTLKWFAEIINSLNIPEVEVFDVHSNVSLALINNVKNIEPDEAINFVLDFLAKDYNLNKEDIVIVFPDDGASKRYRHIFEGNDNQYKICAGVKHRAWSDGKLISLDVIADFDLKGKTALIIDDICSTGGTFMMCQESLEKQGVKQSALFVSHLEMQSVDKELFNKCRVFTGRNPTVEVELKTGLFCYNVIDEK